MTTSPKGGFGFGSLPASIARLRATRNRLAGAITQVLIDEARDAKNWDSPDRDLVHERDTLERAREILLTPPPIHETRDEISWRIEARKDLAQFEGERSHGEPYAAERSPNVH